MRRLILTTLLALAGGLSAMADNPERVVIPQTVVREEATSENYKHQFGRMEGRERVALYTRDMWSVKSNYKNQVRRSLEKKNISGAKSKKESIVSDQNYKHQVPLKHQ